jgi:hypothetical protein
MNLQQLMQDAPHGIPVRARIRDQIYFWICSSGYDDFRTKNYGSVQSSLVFILDHWIP